MCQLCLVNLGSKKRNTVWMTNSLLINSIDSHQDGVGVVDTGSPDREIWKSVYGAINTTNLADCVNLAITSNSPVIGHVRLASARNKVVEEVLSQKNAHPFLSPCKEFILAHNGTLEFREYNDKRKDLKEYKGLIDTEIFIHELSKNYKKHKLMQQALKRTMEDFKGKFAFLIYSIREDAVFIVRGKTAKLHKVTISIEGKEVGWAVNTEKMSLFDTMRIFQQNWYLLTKQKVTFKKIDDEYHTVEELEEESIYWIKDNILEVIGEIEENTTHKRVVTNPPSRMFPMGIKANDGQENKDIKTPAFTSPKVKGLRERKKHGINYKNVIYNTLTYDNIVDSLIGWSNAHNITTLELDYLFSLVYGHGFSGASMEELQIFILKVLKELAPHDSRKKRKKGWNKVLNAFQDINGMYIYCIDNRLEFPWMLNDKGTLVEIANDEKEKLRLRKEEIKKNKEDNK